MPVARAGVAALVLAAGLVACTDDHASTPPPAREASVGVIEVITCRGLPARGGAVHLGDGWWVTAAHTVEEVRELTLRIDGVDHVAEVAVADERSDLALVRADTALAVPAALAEPVAGTAVLAAPSGRRPVEVSAPHAIRAHALDGAVRRWDGLSVLDDVRPGDSGSPLFQGAELVGVVVLADTDRDRGFAVAATEITALLDGQRDVGNLQPGRNGCSSGLGS